MGGERTHARRAPRRAPEQRRWGAQRPPVLLWGSRCVATLLDLARDAARVVVPVECAGCGAFDEPLCLDCSELLRSGLRRCEDGAPRLDRMDGVPAFPVWTLLAYSGVVRELVVSWKDRGRADLTDPLCAAMGRGAREVADLVASAVEELGVSGSGLHVVPVPTSAASRRRRGADLVRELAEAVADGVAARGVPAVLDPCLVHAGRTRDQVGLGVRARQRNRSRSVRMGRPLRPSALVLLVDDVLTTGATLGACERTLSAAGALVIGGFVIAATPRPTPRQTPPISGWRDG